MKATEFVADKLISDFIDSLWLEDETRVLYGEDFIDHKEALEQLETVRQEIRSLLIIGLENR